MPYSPTEIFIFCALLHNLQITHTLEPDEEEMDADITELWTPAASEEATTKE